MRGHVRRRGVRWQAVYDGPPTLGEDGRRRRGRQRSRTFASKGEANDWLHEQLEPKRKQLRRRDPGNLTVGEWCADWLELLEHDDDLRGSTREFYRRRVEVHIVPALGAIRLRDLTVEHVRDFYATLPAGVRQKVNSTLRPALADAVEDGKLAINPASLATRRRRGKRSGAKPPRKWRAWSERELNTFLEETADDRLFAMWRVYSMTGARRGELLALRWSDVEENAIHIERAFVLAGSLVVLEGTKTGRERRVDIDDGTATALEAWRKVQIAERLAAGPAWIGEEWVFTTLVGSPLKPDWASRRFQDLIAELDVKRIRLHDLRHTHASVLLKAGVPVHVVSERLGHSSLVTTMSTYAHLIGSEQRTAAEMADKALTNAAAAHPERR